MKILIAARDWVSRAGLKLAIEGLGSQVRAVEAGNFAEALAIAADQGDLDLVVLDLAMRDMDGLAGLEAMCRRLPKTPVVVLSAQESRHEVLRALALGATGYIQAGATGPEIVKYLRAVLAGEIYVPRGLLEQRDRFEPGPEGRPRLTAGEAAESLTGRQREVFALLADGLSNAEIARRMGLSVHTVRLHISAILKTLGVSNRTQAALLAASYAVSRGSRADDSSRR